MKTFLVGLHSYLAAGYEYINIDDCWTELEREDGKIVADKKRFPRGVKWLSDYVCEWMSSKTFKYLIKFHWKGSLKRFEVRNLFGLRNEGKCFSYLCLSYFIKFEFLSNKLEWFSCS